ncbi:SET and MYND domain-containing protein (SMYD)-like protein [Dinothrombium tinctorium]|uniref:SET and MYND domain-containing protein (SMYD)-like protein n=1 Tax=Dinothrombium tinctorium TaxID=1965070 RepID=A0A443QV89_9ACAR|nr:SET and MYND domain-containing protein (SMYD)-like protein [Dinothrombium tinctorium]RWS06976.1 SET and MYND domain-containing protein (SMYD)-like protein [Dinothrombium tinctorium]
MSALNDSNVSEFVLEANEIKDDEEFGNDFSKFIETLRCKFIDEEKFLKLSSNEEKVKYCLQNECVREMMKSFIEKNGSNARVKCSTKARSHRIEGNKFYKQKKYEEAFKCYSQALLEAPFPSHSCSCEELSLAFANRSAASFHLKQYRQCLKDIDYAIKYKYPSNQMHTLLLRRALCLKAFDNLKEAENSINEALNRIEDLTGQNNCEIEAINQMNKQDLKKSIMESFISFKDCCKADKTETYKETFTPQLNHNSKVPSANSFVKLNHSEAKGRYLTVTKRVDLDEAILAEKPFAAILNIQCIDHFCHNCCQELNEALFPCKNCCEVQFCSETCYEEAMQSYHALECESISLIQSTGVVRLALRILLTAGIDKARIVAKENIEKSGNQKHLRDYKSLLSLIDHSDNVPFVVSARQTLAACFYLVLLSLKMSLIQENDKDFYFIGALILKHIQQVSCNSMVMFHQPLIPGPMDIIGIDVKNQVIGTAIYSTLSLVNHSCVPNCDAFFNGSFIVLKARQSIAVGEEITISYGPLYRKMSRIERLATLKSQYYFGCECTACNLRTIDEKKLEGMIEIDAVYCNECRGPFILDSETEGGCLKCKTKKFNEVETSLCISNAKKLLSIGKALIQFGRVTDAEKQFQKALTYLNKVCFANNRLMVTVYTELFYANILKENFEEAKKYCEEALKIKRLIFGEESAEYYCTLLQLMNIKWAQQKKVYQKSATNTHRINSMNKKLIQKLENESKDVIARTKNLLNTFKTMNVYTILDSSVVTCLKELVELEKVRIQSNK